MMESKGRMFVEAPTGMECSDMPGCIPTDLQLEFNEDKLKQATDPHFKLLHKVKSVAYTPDRYVLLYERL